MRFKMTVEKFKEKYKDKFPKTKLDELVRDAYMLAVTTTRSISIEMTLIPKVLKKEIRALLKKFYVPTGENRVETTIETKDISTVLNYEISIRLSGKLDLHLLKIIIRSITIISYNNLQGTKANKFCVNFKLDMVGNEKTEVE